MKLNAEQIAEYCHGSVALSSDKIARGVCWDSRQVEPGDLYVAIPGERVDGHAYIGAAFDKGAVAALIMQEPEEALLARAKQAGAALIVVPDTAQAVVDLAKGWRKHLTGRVIGVTGSSGKTTTKNLIRDVLATTYSVVATQGNQNNELGAPRTLLTADEDTQAVVVEMGMQGFGEIAYLADIARPDWGVIVSVGESHIEFLGSRENIARAKGELFEALPEKGMAFVNTQDDFAEFVCTETGLAERGVRISVADGSGKAEVAQGWSCVSGVNDGSVRVWASDVVLDDFGCAKFVLHVARNGAEGEESLPCTLGLRGLHNVGNACLAAAVGAASAIPLTRIVAALEAAVPEAGRQELVQGKCGCTIVNDAYNANPESMRVSLLSFASTPCKGKRIAVLGDMKELGDFGIAAHENIGKLVATLPLDLVICVGDLAAHIASAALKAGANGDSLLRLASVEDVLAELALRLAADDSVLVKASHSMGLDRVVEGLQA